MALLDDFLTQKELAAELRISPRTVMRWQGKPDGLPHVELGGRVYYRRSSVLDWIGAHERRPNPRRAA
jgi:hypothetical protein